MSATSLKLAAFGLIRTTFVLVKFLLEGSKCLVRFFLSLKNFLCALIIFLDSGIGRENGPQVLESYTQTKTVYVEMNDIDCGQLYQD